MLLNLLLQIIPSDPLSEIFDTPLIMLHCFFLCKRLQFKPYLFVLMYSAWGFIMTVMAESDHKSKLLRCITESSSPYMMPFKPLSGVADKAP